MNYTTKGPKITFEMVMPTASGIDPITFRAGNVLKFTVRVSDLDDTPLGNAFAGKKIGNIIEYDKQKFRILDI